MSFIVIESVVLCAISGVLGGLFGAGIVLADRGAPYKPVTERTLPYLMRRIGFVQSIALFAFSIDNTGGHGIYTPGSFSFPRRAAFVVLLGLVCSGLLEARIFLSGLVQFFLFSGSGVWAVVTIRSLYRMLRRDIPSVIPYSVSLSVVVFVTCWMVGYSVYFGSNRRITAGVLVANVGLLFVVLAVMVVMGYAYLRMRSYLVHIMYPVHPAPDFGGPSPQRAALVAGTRTPETAASPSLGPSLGPVVASVHPLDTPIHIDAATPTALSPRPATVSPRVELVPPTPKSPASVRSSGGSGGAFIDHTHIVKALNKFFFQVLGTELAGGAVLVLVFNTVLARIRDPGLIASSLDVHPSFQPAWNGLVYALCLITALFFSIANPW